MFSTGLGPHLYDDMVTWKPVSHCYQPVNVGNTVETYMDDCNAFPQGPLTFTSPGRELYLFSLVALTFRDVTASVRMTGVGPNLGLSHESTVYDSFDTLSRNVIVDVTRGAVGHVQYKGQSLCCASNAWAAFTVSGTMDPLVAFTAMRTTSFTNMSPVTYDVDTVNTGEFTNSTFTAPQDGIYYFSVSAGLQAYQPLRLHVMKGDEVVLEVLHNSTVHNGEWTTSATTLVNLQTGDHVTVRLVEGAIYSSQELMETSFVGFLYSPINSQKAAWSVSKTQSEFVDEWNRIEYDSVSLLEGVEFIDKTTVLAPVAGVYYVHLSTGRATGDNSGAIVYTNNTDPYSFAYLYHYFDSANGYSTLSASYILPLTEGEEVDIRLWDPANIYGNELGATTFMGFLIYET